jgi:hypothetical protein
MKKDLHVLCHTLAERSWCHITSSRCQWFLPGLCSSSDSPVLSCHCQYSSDTHCCCSPAPGNELVTWQIKNNGRDLIPHPAETSKFSGDIWLLVILLLSVYRKCSYGSTWWRHCKCWYVYRSCLLRSRPRSLTQQENRPIGARYSHHVTGQDITW